MPEHVDRACTRLGIGSRVRGRLSVTLKPALLEPSASTASCTVLPWVEMRVKREARGVLGMFYKLVRRVATHPLTD